MGDQSWAFTLPLINATSGEPVSVDRRMGPCTADTAMRARGTTTTSAESLQLAAAAVRTRTQAPPRAAPVTCPSAPTVAAALEEPYTTASVHGLP